MINKSQGVRAVFLISILFFSIILFSFGILNSQEETLFFSVFILWLFLFLKKFSRKQVTTLLFLATFFLFLLGTTLLSYYDESIILRVNDKQTLIHMYKSLYYSLLFLWLGTISKISFLPKIKNGKKINNLKFLRLSSKYIYLFLSIFSLALILEKLLFTRSLGSYTSSYINLQSNLPSYFIKLDVISTNSLFIYLATLPNPADSKVVFFTQFIIAFLTLLYGERTLFVMSIFMFFMYIVLYENTWNLPFSIIKKRHYVLIILGAIFGTIGLDFIVNYRDGSFYEYEGLNQALKNIVVSLGRSIDVIGYEFEYSSLLPRNKFYSFGAIIDFVKGNFLMKKILGTEIFPGNTVEAAVYGNNFADAITYLVRKKSYLNGYGLGSSYIAEVFHDFGYIGVMMINYIYGIILNSGNYLKRNEVVRNTIILISVYNILIAPRNSADGFISAYLNFSFIITVFLTFLMSKFLEKIRGSS